MPEPLLPVAAYIKLEGRFCPFCCSSHHQYIESWATATGRLESRRCDECDGQWQDNYVLASYVLGDEETPHA